MRGLEDAHGPDPLPDPDPDGYPIFGKLARVGLCPDPRKEVVGVGLLFYCPLEGCNELHTDMAMSVAVSTS